MGLNTSHDCWDGPYSSFNAWRTEIAKLLGIDLPKMYGFNENVSESLSWEQHNSDIICKLLNHSDCDGEIRHQDCAAIADRLEELLPSVPANEDGGDRDYFKTKTEKFINGLREASEAGENVEFG